MDNFLYEDQDYFVKLINTNNTLANSKLYEFNYNGRKKNVRIFHMKDDYLLTIMKLRLKICKLEHWFIYTKKPKKGLMLLIPDSLLLTNIENINKNDLLLRNESFIDSLYKSVSFSFLTNSNMFLTRIFHVKIDDKDLVIDLNTTFKNRNDISMKFLNKIGIANYSCKKYCKKVMKEIFPDSINNTEICELIHETFPNDPRVDMLKTNYRNIILINEN